MGMRAPMRRGAPKIVPVIMSAGLAIGVFCGLLFGVGKKSEAVAAEPPSGNNVKPTTEPAPAKAEPGSAPAGLGATAAKPPPPAQGSGAKPGTAVAAGSAAPAPAPAPPPPTPAVVAPKTIKLTVTLKPEAAMTDAKLIVDGIEAQGLTVDVPADKTSVKVEVKSTGFRSIDKKIELKGGDTAIEFEMAKRSTGTPGIRPPKRPDKPPSGGGGLIDI
jgi:hypothetical protein